MSIFKIIRNKNQYPSKVKRAAAGIRTQGYWLGKPMRRAHVFARHTLASLMLKNGSDLLTIKEILRHNSSESSMRYLHLIDDTMRSKYNKFLRLSHGTHSICVTPYPLIFSLETRRVASHPRLSYALIESMLKCGFT